MAYIGARIRELRLQCGVKQKEVASGIGITTHYYNEIEYGRKPARQYIIENIADCLNISVYEITGTPIVKATPGERLRSIRAKKNISQPLLASKLNVPQTTITRWERGLKPIPEQYILMLTEILDVEEGEFYRNDLTRLRESRDFTYKQLALELMNKGLSDIVDTQIESCTLNDLLTKRRIFTLPEDIALWESGFTLGVSEMQISLLAKILLVEREVMEMFFKNKSVVVGSC